jgi:D-3-phosphoglycerate dehydrogenase
MFVLNNCKYVFHQVIEGRANCIFLFLKVLFICPLLTARPTMINTPETRIAIIDDFHPVFMEQLSGSGLSVAYEPGITAADVRGFVKDAEIVAVRSKIRFDRELIASLPNLRCIARGGAGMDNIDEAFAAEKNITLLNAPEGNRDAVAEHVVGLLLGLSKHISRSSWEVRNLEWHREANRGWEIGGKTIGIIGFGNTGSSLAKKLSGFDCRVLAYDKYLGGFHSPYAQAVDLQTLMSEADVLSLHIPLNTSSRQMVDAAFIKGMKDGVVLVNSSRGEMVNTEAVLEALQAGKIKAFATDVLENEDFGKLTKKETNILSGLFESGRVIITPHIAGWSVESYEKIARVLAGKIIGFVRS